MRVQMEAVHFSADARLLAAIEAKLAKLEHYFDKIVEARVMLRLENSGQVRDKIAEIKILIPNGVIFIRETSKTFEIAIDKAFFVIKRQLIKFKKKKAPSKVKKEQSSEITDFVIPM